MIIFKALYAPVFFAVSLASGLFLVSTGGPLHGLIVIAGVMIAVSFMAEQIAPYCTNWNRSRGDRLRDALHAIVNEASVAVSLFMLPALTMLLSFEGVWPDHWPLIGQLGIAILVADVGITLAHFASHRFETLWRLHAPHHSVKRMYGFNGLMKHPLHQGIELTAGSIPLVLLGMPVEVAALLSLAVATQLLLQHSNVDMKIGSLRFMWAVAPVHRFHHLNKAGEGDVNFGLFLTVWDHLLGTAYYDEKRTFNSDDLGIEDQPNYPVDYLSQLAKPFRF